MNSFTSAVRPFTHSPTFRTALSQSVPPVEMRRTLHALDAACLFLVGRYLVRPLLALREYIRPRAAAGHVMATAAEPLAHEMMLGLFTIPGLRWTLALVMRGCNGQATAILAARVVRLDHDQMKASGASLVALRGRTAWVSSWSGVGHERNIYTAWPNPATTAPACGGSPSRLRCLQRPSHRHRGAHGRDPHARVLGGPAGWTFLPAPRVAPRQPAAGRASHGADGRQITARAGWGRHREGTGAMKKRDHISTIGNTEHSIPRADIDAVVAAGASALIVFVTAVAAATQREGLTVDQRNLLARSVLADVAGALPPCARMLDCSDATIEALPLALREVLS